MGMIDAGIAAFPEIHVDFDGGRTAILQDEGGAKRSVFSVKNDAVGSVDLFHLFRRVHDALDGHFVQNWPSGFESGDGQV